MSDGAVSYGFCLVVEGRVSEAEALIDRVVEATSDQERRLMLEAELSGWGYAGYEFPTARDRLARVTANLVGESPAERLLLGLRACDAITAGAITAADAADLIHRGLGEGSLLSALGPESPIYMRMLIGLSQTDELDLLDRELAAATIEARRRGASYGLAIGSTLRGRTAWKRGQLLTAEAEARTGLEITSQIGRLRVFPFPLTLLIEVLDEAGGLDEAERPLEKHDLNGRVPPSLPYTEILRARGQLRITEGRLDLGIEDLEEVRARLEVGVSPPPVRANLARALVPALVHAGREYEAREIADETLRIAHAYGAPRNVAHALRARTLTQRNGPDVDQLWEAAATYDRIGAPIELARTLIDIGAALRRRRQPAAARDPLRRALDLARSRGARPLAERAEHELRAAGARPRRDRITGRDALTATEGRIANLAIEGMTNRQIAETLFITRKTVESHLEHIFRKLGIHARRELERALATEGTLAPID